MAISVASFCFLFTLLTTPLLVSAASPCPTITKTTHHSWCPTPTPAFCAQPDCILLSVLDIPCGCPTAVPTTTSYTSCPLRCEAGCGVETLTEFQPCDTSSTTPTTTPPTTTYPTTTVPSGCVTITETTGAGCPTFTDCTIAECILEKTITLECGCASIYTATSCATGCQVGCATAYDTVYIPCPTSPPSPTTSTVAPT